MKRRPSRAKPRVLIATPGYKPGHFTALLREPSEASPQGWPPHFDAQYQRTREVEQSEAARKSREDQILKGNFGTIAGLSAKSDARLYKSAANQLAIKVKRGAA